MKNNELEKWIKAAGIRAVKTIAQAAAAGIGTAAVMGQVDWRYTEAYGFLCFARGRENVNSEPTPSVLTTWMFSL